jgi:hypothetical protein
MKNRKKKTRLSLHLQRESQFIVDFPISSFSILLSRNDYLVLPYLLCRRNSTLAASARTLWKRGEMI